MERCIPKTVLCPSIGRGFVALCTRFIVVHNLMPSCWDRFSLSKAYRKGIGYPWLVSVQVKKVIVGKIWVDYVF